MVGRKTTAVGRVSRVTAKFAFISTELGSVFCPLSASIPPEEHLPDMTSRYRSGDLVHVTAVEQDGKNGCKWLATKLRPTKISLSKTPQSHEQMVGCGDFPAFSRKNETSHAENNIHQQYVASVRSVTETFAFTDCSLGTVFVPGAAFSATEVSRLNAYLSIGDRLLISCKPQPEVNGCKWIASKATKIQPTNPEQNAVSGNGSIVSLTETVAMVWSKTHGQIECPLLTWNGGDGGEDVCWLNEILKIGDEVVYQARVRARGLRAFTWTSPGFRGGAADRVLLNDSYTQTAPTVAEMTIRALRPHIDQILDSKPMIKLLLDYEN